MRAFLIPALLIAFAGAASAKTCAEYEAEVLAGGEAILALVEEGQASAAQFDETSQLLEHAIEAGDRQGWDEASERTVRDLETELDQLRADYFAFEDRAVIRHADLMQVIAAYEQACEAQARTQDLLDELGIGDLPR